MADKFWIYHPDYEPVIVDKEECEKLLGEGWYDSPSKFPSKKEKGLAGSEVAQKEQATQGKPAVTGEAMKDETPLPVRMQEHSRPEQENHVQNANEIVQEDKARFTNHKTETKAPEEDSGKATIHKASDKADSNKSQGRKER